MVRDDVLNWRAIWLEFNEWCDNRPLYLDDDWRAQQKALHGIIERHVRKEFGKRLSRNQMGLDNTA